MKNFLFYTIFGFLLIIAACGDGNVLVRTDTSIQKAIDVQVIDEYFISKGYAAADIDTTESGVRYVVVETGEGDSINESDHVTFNYISSLVNDTIFDTSFEGIADSIRTKVTADKVGKTDTIVHELILQEFSESRVYQPIEITYSSSGWTLREGFPYRTTQQFFGDGIKDGISASLNGNENNPKQFARVGGHVIVAIPSALAFGTINNNLVNRLIESNQVIIFELFPIKVEQ